MFPSIYLADLLKTNEPPSNTAIQEVIGLYTEARSDLHHIDSEIQRLQQRRAVIQKSIDSYITILSPIRRLPTDILREIFYHCFHSNRNPIMSATEAPMLLTQVCSLWRSIALTTPNIWAKLHIPLPGDPHMSSSYGIITDKAIEVRRQIFSEVMGRRCQIVKEWLERSGSCFLTLSISYPSSYISGHGRVGIEVGSDISVHRLFQILVLFVQRWQHLDLSIPPSIYQHLEGMIPSRAMLFSLRTLRGAMRSPNPISKDILIQAPNLKTLWVDDPELIITVQGPSPTIAWGQLTDLCFICPILCEDFLMLLRSCHSLITCQTQIRIAQPFDTYPSIQAAGEVFLPHLQTLKLSEFSGPPTIALRSIRAPSLTSFQYRCPDQYSRHLGPQSTAEPSNFETMTWFVENSTSTLKILAIDPPSLPCGIALPLLQLARGISHLYIGRIPHFQSEMFTQGEDDLNLPPEDSIDLNVLYAEYPDSEEGILLPNLEVLEVNSIFNITDDQLLQLFISRIDASTRGHTCPLKWVKLRIWRRKQRDIAEKVIAYARSVGIEMKLEISYLRIGPRYAGRLSPSFLSSGSHLLGVSSFEPFL